MAADQKTRLAHLKSKRSYNVAELCEVCDLEEAILKEEIDADTKRWGNWRYSPTEPPSIDYAPYRYEIVLDRIDTASKLGDWLLHLQEKRWVTPDDLGQLVTALVDLSRVRYHRIKGRGDG